MGGLCKACNKSPRCPVRTEGCSGPPTPGHRGLPRPRASCSECKPGTSGPSPLGTPVLRTIDANTSEAESVNAKATTFGECFDGYYKFGRTPWWKQDKTILCCTKNRWTKSTFAGDLKKMKFVCKKEEDPPEDFYKPVIVDRRR